MEREEAIQTIEGLYPADHDSIAGLIGKGLIVQAKINTNFHDYSWRDLPDNVLKEYARLCQQKDNQETKKFLKNDKQ